MTIAQLDAFFPYFCFSYGAIMTVVLASDRLGRIADRKLPKELVAQWRSHQTLALICLIVGTAWVLQNLWLA